ncbi:hypothetical protein [Chitinophaga sp. YIM B06452]|uniref:hypothetical protein n=1 Tax=Chitinophaga sp. YIM B06452 TaxID=3082158 RepID=UPI0031FE8D93
MPEATLITWTKMTIIQEFKRIHIETGRIPTMKVIREKNTSLADAIQQKFGGITLLKEKAGPYYTPRSKLTEEEVVVVLNKFCKTNKGELKNTHLFTLLQKAGEYSLYKAILKYGGLHQLNASYHLGLQLRCYSRSKEDILDALRKIKKDGYPITQASLLNIGQSGILQSIKKYGTLSDFKEQLGISVRRTKRWSEKEIIRKYKSLHKQWGCVPSNKSLCNAGYGNLNGAIQLHFGGIVALRDKIGLASYKKPDHYWTLKKTLQTFRLFLKDNKMELKSSSVYGLLEAKQLHGLRTAIGKWGGLRKLNKQYKLGLVLQGEKWPREKVLKLLLQLHKKGIAITQKYLIQSGRSDLIGAIYKYGTMNELKGELGIMIKRHNYWTDDKIINELSPLIAALGSMPSNSMLNAMGKSDVARAMAKRGGHAKFCKLLNTKISKTHRSWDGYFLQSAYESIFDNILLKYNIQRKVHVRISDNHKYICDFLIGATYIEIAGFSKEEHPLYYKNLEKKIKLYADLKKDYLIIYKETFTKGIEQIEKNVLAKLNCILPVKQSIDSCVSSIDIKPAVFWADIENIKRELLPLVDKYGRMPLDIELRREKKAGLIGGIYKYHGNFYELGKVLNIPVLNKPKGYFTYEKALCTYTELSKEQGRYLTLKELAKMKLYGIISIIQKNGGIYAAKTACNLKFAHERRPYRIFDIDEAVAEYTRLSMEKGGFMKEREIKACNGTLANYIQTHGGYYKIQKLTKLSFSPEMLPKGYYSQDQVVDLYKRLCMDKGYFLTKREALTLTSHKIIGYIERNIGFERLRQLTGLNLKVNKDIRRTSAEAKQAAVEKYTQHCIKQGCLLTMKQLKNLGEGKLVGFIIRELGVRELHKIVTVNIPVKPVAPVIKQRKRMEKKSDGIERYKALCLRHGRHLSDKELCEMGQRYLSGLISRNGGFAAFRKECGLTYQQQAPRHGYKAEDAVTEYKEISIQQDAFPTHRELLTLGKTELSRAILTFGGYNKIRDLTGLKKQVRKLANKKEHNIKEVLDVFRKLSIKKGQFFSKNDFIAIGEQKLAWFIQNNGGYRRFQKISGLSVRKMHKPNQKKS